MITPRTIPASFIEIRTTSQLPEQISRSVHMWLLREILKQVAPGCPIELKFAGDVD